jgi:hypothetical protein
VDGEEAINHTTTTTHRHHTTTPDLAQTSRTMAQPHSKAGALDSGLVPSVELLVLGLRTVWATVATRLVVAAGGATEAEVHGMMVAKAPQDHRLGRRASRARDMRAQALARLRDVKV